MTKYDNLGLAARNGLHAALLAQRGFRGDRDVLDGDLGFWRFCGEGSACDWEALTGELGQRWVTSELKYKTFPAVISQSAVGGLVVEMLRQHAISPNQIEALSIRRQLGERQQPEIRTPLDANLSWIANVAMAALGLTPRWRCQDPAVYTRPDVQALLGRITIGPLTAEDLASRTGPYPVRATLRARGQTFEGASETLPELDDAALGAKFRENASAVLDAPTAERLEAACWAIEQAPSVHDLAAVLGQDGRGNAG
jgi:2-methylcitrate dehydratase PrpD